MHHGGVTYQRDFSLDGGDEGNHEKTDTEECWSSSDICITVLLPSWDTILTCLLLAASILQGTDLR